MFRVDKNVAMDMDVLTKMSGKNQHFCIFALVHLKLSYAKFALCFVFLVTLCSDPSFYRMMGMYVLHNH
jgi:hypothetical protein